MRVGDGAERRGHSVWPERIVLYYMGYEVRTELMTDLTLATVVSGSGEE